MDEIKIILRVKFEEIRRRILLVLDQLDDQQVNWRPNESSNSIANLIIHISANISERISKGMNHKEYRRNRDAEFEAIYKTKHELVVIMNQSFDEIIMTLETMDEIRFQKTQTVRNRERSNLDMFIQCVAHFSEHMGQIFYIGKMINDDNYITTSVPKKKQCES
jgi:uncharacterized damage-inducible protein DinB